MIIMAFDSTAKVASVAVCEDDRPLGRFDVDNGLTHSELLLPMAESLLEKLKLSFDDIELFATTAGPGSFTGVRIGTALVKGLSLERGIPTVAVSTLESLAQNLSGLDGIIVPVMDARRGQLYTAIFKSQNGEAVRISEDAALSVAELAERLLTLGNEKIYLVGDGYAVAMTGLSERGVKLSATPRLLIDQSAYSCAVVAKRKYELGDWVSDTELFPTYLRVPQAERERLERENKTKENI